MALLSAATSALTAALGRSCFLGFLVLFVWADLQFIGLVVKVLCLL